MVGHVSKRMTLGTKSLEKGRQGNRSSVMNGHLSAFWLKQPISSQSFIAERHLMFE
jgi:hypothetical protein